MKKVWIRTYLFHTWLRNLGQVMEPESLSLEHKVEEENQLASQDH